MKKLISIFFILLLPLLTGCNREIYKVVLNKEMAVFLYNQNKDLIGNIDSALKNTAYVVVYDESNGENLFAVYDKYGLIAKRYLKSRSYYELKDIDRSSQKKLQCHLINFKNRIDNISKKEKFVDAETITTEVELKEICKEIEISSKKFKVCVDDKIRKIKVKKL